MMYTDAKLYPTCPTWDWDCPYINDLGFCTMFKVEGVLPYDECDAFYGLEDEEEEDE